MRPDALTNALGRLVEQCLDQEPHPVCCVCHEYPAVAGRVFLPDAQEDGMIRARVLPLCGCCLCLPNLEARLAQVISLARARGQGVWN
jgi:hypothetical protein